MNNTDSNTKENTNGHPLPGTSPADRGVHVLGIRHHGPGSARNVLDFLQRVQPDLILVEGPPEADDLLTWATHQQLTPPVALLCYQPDEPSRSVFYPFAQFSPEWQAIQYARSNKIPVRFFDLPIAHQLAIEKEKGMGQINPLPELPVQERDEAGYDLKKDPVSYLDFSQLSRSSQ